MRLWGRRGIRAVSNMTSRVIEFQKGMPADDMLGRPLLEKTLPEISAHVESTYQLLNYGDDSGPLSFRSSVARFLNRMYPDIAEGSTRPVAPGEVFSSSGNSHAVSVISSLLLSGGPHTVLVDDPTYPFSVLTFGDHKACVVGVPQKNGQTNVDEMEIEIGKAREAGQPVALIYVIPSYHNPTGECMSEATRQALVDMARRQKVWIISDDVYQMLGFDPTSTPKALSSFENDLPGSECRVLSLGTFSKIFAPALRAGWIYTRNPDFYARLLKHGEHISGGAFSSFACRVGERMIDSGRQEELIGFIRKRLADKCKFMCGQLRQELGNLVEFSEPRGGYFIWVRLSDQIKISPSALRKECMSLEPVALNFFPGTVFSASATSTVAIKYLRLSFALYDENVIREGVSILGAVIKKHLV